MSRPGPGGRGRPRVSGGILLLSLGLLWGCDALLEAESPTRVPGTLLDNPAMAGIVVLGVQNDFECAYSNYVAGSGLFTDELYASSDYNGYNQIDGRTLGPGYGNTTDCVDETGFALHRPIHTARFTADDAARRLKGFTDAEVPGRISLLAKALAYGGYAVTLLGEGYCKAVITEGGPALDPPDVLRGAEARLTEAIHYASLSGNQRILDLARVGRARVRLNLGNHEGAAADARQVTEGFRLDATYALTNVLRENQLSVAMFRGADVSVEPGFWHMEVEGVPDVRVALTHLGRLGPDGRTPLVTADRHERADSPIRLASWVEAQLILAEVEPGEEAVARINRLRQEHGLPPFTPVRPLTPEIVRAQVMEERRRELFLQGHRLNDLRRSGQPFKQGVNHKGTLHYGSRTCFPLPLRESTNNPNARP